MLDFIVTSELANMRLDRVIMEINPDLSRTFAARLIEDGQALVNGKKVGKSFRVAIGDCIKVDVPPLREAQAIPQEIPLEIVYEDGELLVVNKPKGMVVHPAPGHEEGTIVNALLAYCKDLSGIGGVERPGIVHRIDKDTSGLLIVAKNDMAHQRLSAQLKTRTLSRTYYAIALGRFKADKGTINAPIGRSLRDRKKMAVVQNGREALTHYEVIEAFEGYTLVKCKLETGRTHQIRVHLSHIGHPIAGDMVYGNKSDKSKLEGQALHAISLEFIHPVSGERVECSCDLPQYFSEFLEKLRG